MGWGPKSYMDIDTGDITVVSGDENGGSIFHISNKKKK